MSTKKQMHAMIDAAEHFNSDLTQVIGSDSKGKVVAVSVFAQGAYAKQLSRFLRTIDKQIAQAERKAAKP